MTYQPTEWKNREVEKPRTYTIQENEGGTVTLMPAEGNVIEPGTPIIASTMNNIEQGIADTQSELNTHLAESASKHINEIGSNPNGSFIKFDDGTQICVGKINGTLTSSPQGALYYSEGTNITYPANFISTPSVSFMADRSEWVGATAITITEIGVDPKHFFIAEVSSFAIRIDWHAVGRWK